jgi:arylsulfatase
VLPLDPRMAPRFNPELAGRPQLINRDVQLLFPGMGSLTEGCVLNTKNKSHTITAAIVIPEGGADGVLINQGGITGGWVLYVKEGRLAYHYSFLGLQHDLVIAERALPTGEHQVRMEFVYDGGGLGKGGTATLFVDGDEVGSGRIERTHAFSFSLDETTDVGRDTGSPVCDDYLVGANAFTGAISWIRLEIGADSHDHLIEESDLMHLAMSRQ